MELDGSRTGGLNKAVGGGGGSAAALPPPEGDVIGKLKYAKNRILTAMTERGADEVARQVGVDVPPVREVRQEGGERVGGVMWYEEEDYINDVVMALHYGMAGMRLFMERVELFVD